MGLTSSLMVLLTVVPLFVFLVLPRLMVTVTLRIVVLPPIWTHMLLPPRSSRLPAYKFSGLLFSSGLQYGPICCYLQGLRDYLLINFQGSFSLQASNMDPYVVTSKVFETTCL